MDPLKGRKMGQGRIRANSSPFSSATNVPTGLKEKTKACEPFILAEVIAVCWGRDLILSGAQSSNYTPVTPCWSDGLLTSVLGI